MSPVKLMWSATRLSPTLRLLIIPTVCALGMIVSIFVASRLERDFRNNLEQVFKQRVELGDLASSVQQLRKTLDFPRVLDADFVAVLTERVQEVEQKVKAQNLASRVGELVLPSKELTSIIAAKQGFDRLSATAIQIERAHGLRVSLKAPESVDGSVIRRVVNLLDEYAIASAAIRGSRSGQQSISQLATASLGLGENLTAALAETRRKSTPQIWRDVFSTVPQEPSDFVDRLLMDSRLLEEFQAQRGRALGRLEQVSAKIDSAERLLLGSRADGGLLLGATILTWTGIGFGLLGLGWSAFRLTQRISRVDAQKLEAVVEVVPSAKSADEAEVVEGRVESDDVERAFASRVAQAATLSTQTIATIAAESVVADIESDEVTSGYWIASGSMAERRVALLDKQSVQLEQHVKSVLAAADSLAGRADLVVQSLQLVRENQTNTDPVDEVAVVRKRVDELQALAINLSLQVAGGEVHEPVLDDLERFNQELELLASDVKRMGAHRSDPSLERRLLGTIDEGRRMIAAADTLKERTEILYDDAQRFRRHSEALIRGIQEGAVNEVPLRLLKDLKNLT